ncbi:kinase [Streptococcus castoreus]|uniref:kinase n=1 Tax=Streptococcus castoreus TaxID=254786 RepID=UPI0003F8B2CB|nr:kinase [Streptococcus castoreus]
MTKRIIIRGNSASGKSSLARALQNALGENCLLLSQDKLRREMLLAHDGFDTPTISLILNLLDYGQQHCDYIILEGILKADWYQPVWEGIAERFQGKIYAYYYDLPFEETVKRHASRQKALQFGEESLKRWWQQQDYLKLIPEKRLTAKLSLEEVEHLILEDIHH